MTAYLVALVGALAVLVLIVELLRRRQLKEKYAVLWLVVGSGTTLLAIFPSLLSATADLVGVQVPANLLFFAALLLLLGVCVHLSWELSRVEDETRILAEEVALLRMDLERPRPAEPRPVQSRPAQSRPVQSRPVQSRPVQSQPERSPTGEDERA